MPESAIGDRCSGSMGKCWGCPKPLPLGLEIPGIIQSYAFVAAGSGLSDDKEQGLMELEAMANKLMANKACSRLEDDEPICGSSSHGE